MEANQEDHPDYQRGFNEGYIMRKYLPDLADKLGPAIDKSDRGLGFQDGEHQFDLEQQKDRYPAWLRDDRLLNIDKGHDKTKEKDMGDLEPER